jgi:PKD repeat protein
MTCQQPGQDVFSANVEVTRGQHVTVDWAGGPCGVDPVVNTPPVAGFDYTPASPEVGQQVNFISTSTDPDGTIDPSMTKWDLDDDGQFDDATGLTASKTFAAAGSYDVAVEVTDDDGDSDTRTRSVAVQAPADAAPNADFTFFPSSPSVNENVVFTSTSTDSDGTVETLEWDIDGDLEFDDAVGGLVVRAFTEPGTYRVSLKATDDDGVSDVKTKDVIVRGPAGPIPPTSTTGGGTAGSVVTISPDSRSSCKRKSARKHRHRGRRCARRHR